MPSPTNSTSLHWSHVLLQINKQNKNKEIKDLKAQSHHNMDLAFNDPSEQSSELRTLVNSPGPRKRCFLRHTSQVRSWAGMMLGLPSHELCGIHEAVEPVGSAATM